MSEANAGTHTTGLPDATEGLITIRIGRSVFGIPVDAVGEVLEPPPVTAIPQLPEPVVGVAEVRDRIAAVVDLGLRLAGRAVEPPGRLLSVTDERTGDAVGVLVDGVVGLAPLPEDGPEPPSDAEELPAPARFVEGVVHAAGSAVAVLDVAEVLALEPPEA